MTSASFTGAGPLQAADTPLRTDTRRITGNARVMARSLTKNSATLQNRSQAAQLDWAVVSNLRRLAMRTVWSVVGCVLATVTLLQAQAPAGTQPLQGRWTVTA